MKKHSLFLIIIMVVSFTFAYLFFYSGIKTKVKIFANYQENSDVSYNVILNDNNIYDNNVIGEDEKYISKLVDKILIDFNYDVLYDKYISGYYSYSVDSYVVAYEDDINDSLWIKENKLLDNKVTVLNQNKLNEIDIKDSVEIDYQYYKNFIDSFIDEYKINISGYLMVKVNVNLTLDFVGFSEQIDDVKEIKIIIPLSYDTFKINVIDNNKDIDNYYEWSQKSSVNYLFLILGALFLSIGLSLLVVIIKEMVIISKRETKFSKNLRKILEDYGDIIINVDKFYHKKKYNLIYVDNFDELLDVYRKEEKPISFKEIKKNREAIFLIIDDDNAWVYRMINKDELLDEK